jgi:hypothetical protein
VLKNVGIKNSDAGELPRRKHKTFTTRRNFEIKNSFIILRFICAVKNQTNFDVETLATTLRRVDHLKTAETGWDPYANNCNLIVFYVFW